MVRLSVVVGLACFAASWTAQAGNPADLVGTWSYGTSGSWKKGPCPTGDAAKGDLKIAKKGKSLTLTFVSGRTCRPASMCTFTGTLKHKKYVGSNSAKVDSEGGKVTNTITLTLQSPKSAAGSSSSSYKHPSGMTCTWGSKISISKKK